MDLQTVGSVAAGAVAYFVARPLERYAARVATTMPLPQHPDVERDVLGALAATPELYRAVSELTTEDFVVPVHAAIWGALVAAAGEVGIDPAVSRDDAAGEAMGVVTEAARAALPAEVVELWTAMPAGENVTAPTIVAWAEDLVGATENRLGGIPPVVIDDPDEPLARAQRTPSALRTHAVGIVVALATCLSLASIPTMDAEGALIAAALLTMIGTCALISLIDIDTCYLPRRPMWRGGAVTWAFTAAAAYVAGSIGRVVAALVVTVGVLVVLEASLAVHRRLRRINAFGMGDTKLLLLTLGLPTALTGSLALVYLTFTLANIIGILGWVVGWARGRNSVTTRIPMGPYLAAGWVLAWIVTAGGAALPEGF